MKILRTLVALAALLLAGVAHAAVTNANHAQSFTTVYARPITFTATNGRDLIMGVVCGGGTVSGVTDNSSGTPAWTLDRTITLVGDTGYIYRRANISGSPTTVNVTCSVETFVDTWLFEDDATNDSSQPGSSQTQQYSATFATSHTANLTVPNANDLCILFLDPEFNEDDFTAPSGWARLRTGNAPYEVAYNTSNIGSGSQTAVFTVGAAENVYFTATYYTRGGGGGGTAVPVFMHHYNQQTVR